MLSRRNIDIGKLKVYYLNIDRVGILRIFYSPVGNLFKFFLTRKVLNYIHCIR